VCIGVKGKVLEAGNGYAKVDTEKGVREVKFIDPVKKGDDVIISMGYIVQNNTGGR